MIAENATGTRRLSILIAGFIATAVLFLLIGLWQTPKQSAEWVVYEPEPLLVGVYEPSLDGVIRRVDSDGIPVVAGVDVDLAFDRCIPDIGPDEQLPVESVRTWVVEYGDRTFQNGQETFPERVRVVPFTGGCDTYSIDVLLWEPAVAFAATQTDATIKVRFTLRPVDGRPSQYIPVVIESESFRVAPVPGVASIVKLNQE